MLVEGETVEIWISVVGFFGGGCFFSELQCLFWPLLFSVMSLLRTVCTTHLKFWMLEAVCFQIEVHRNKSSFLVLNLGNVRDLSQGITAPVSETFGFRFAGSRDSFLFPYVSL